LRLNTKIQSVFTIKLNLRNPSMVIYTIKAAREWDDDTWRNVYIIYHYAGTSHK